MLIPGNLYKTKARLELVLLSSQQFQYFLKVKSFKNNGFDLEFFDIKKGEVVIFLESYKDFANSRKWYLIKFLYKNIIGYDFTDSDEPEANDLILING